LRTSTQTSTARSTQQVRTPVPPLHTRPTLSKLRIATLTSPLEAISQNLSSLSIDAQKRAEKDSQKKAAKAATAEARRAEELASSKILIKRIERNKRKYVTAVQGLEAFGLDIKKVAKDFGKKFATGSSVTKIPGGGEEIIVQGDLSEDIMEFLVDKYEEVPEDNIELIEDKKKKKAEMV
jgi:density-regulated protein DRP1